MTKPVYTTLILAAGALVLAWVLNPAPERHRARIAEAIAERSPLAEVLGIGQLTAFASTYHSLGVASYTTVGDRAVSVGAFGMVLVSESGQAGSAVHYSMATELVRLSVVRVAPHQNVLSRAAGNTPLIADAADRRGRSQRGVAG